MALEISTRGTDYYRTVASRVHQEMYRVHTRERSLKVEHDDVISAAATILSNYEDEKGDDQAQYESDEDHVAEKTKEETAEQRELYIDASAVFALGLKVSHVLRDLHAELKGYSDEGHDEDRREGDIRSDIAQCERSLQMIAEGVENCGRKINNPALRLAVLDAGQQMRGMGSKITDDEESIEDGEDGSEDAGK